ncbi:hypothetical protein AMAG_01877 [Allomyces macrogynus ATCC 38327]|uniref:Uncharacterized protein n=1 Tax=Allomyces macrogynus (strain ATCC 38327) TaxID=578462 RepID=A0A0L0S0G9_ALLM3|nr:hypothetical protein AMAG_01877 [Allomyces macrogynus ATCC 38327]|eukprot:KNE56033.1 hypothetical protein AMAG_01877 [Allomyces macrogynus ATCC 38327]
MPSSEPSSTISNASSITGPPMVTIARPRATAARAGAAPSPSATLPTLTPSISYEFLAASDVDSTTEAVRLNLALMDRFDRGDSLSLHLAPLRTKQLASVAATSQHLMMHSSLDWSAWDAALPNGRPRSRTMQSAPVPQAPPTAVAATAAAAGVWSASFGVQWLGLENPRRWFSESRESLSSLFGRPSMGQASVASQPLSLGEDPDLPLYLAQPSYMMIEPSSSDNDSVARGTRSRRHGIVPNPGLPPWQLAGILWHVVMGLWSLVVLLACGPAWTACGLISAAHTVVTVRGIVAICTAWFLWRCAVAKEPRERRQWWYEWFTFWTGLASVAMVFVSFHVTISVPRASDACAISAPRMVGTTRAWAVAGVTGMVVVLLLWVRMWFVCSRGRGSGSTGAQVQSMALGPRTTWG